MSLLTASYLKQAPKWSYQVSFIYALSHSCHWDFKKNISILCPTIFTAQADFSLERLLFGKA